MKIRLIENKDLELCAEMIAQSIASMQNFYPARMIAESLAHFDLQYLKNKMEQSHFYVAVEKNKIIGCGGIDLMKKSENCGVLMGIFVDPNFQKKGVGKAIISTLEKDTLVLECEKILVSSSIPAIPFYRKCGYEHKDNALCFDKNKFWLEKKIK